MEIFYPIGNRIQQERQKMGLTQEQLAEKAGISQNFISLIENGRNMSLAVIIKLAGIFGVTVDYLLSDVMDVNENNIIEQSMAYMRKLTPKQQMFILNMIKQFYETVNEKGTQQ